MLEHGIIRVVYLDLLFWIVLFSPGVFVRLITANSNDVGVRHTPDQRVNVALSHATEADDSDIEAFDHDYDVERNDQTENGNLGGIVVWILQEKNGLDVASDT